ncbi:MAG: hypothetical protein NZ899_10390 [Thermoguttaceae bacterium]|nr:hypothetical protein [Thermoguttaceae bacterium]MDW8078186.1 hypothetical protein [Thermoguttaceae bacterium]
MIWQNRSGFIHKLAAVVSVVLLVGSTSAALQAQEVTRTPVLLQDVRVVCDRAPDCSSLRSLVESVTRQCQTDDERAIALYNVCRYLIYHHAYPTERKPISALKLIHVYGWALCGGEHTVLGALFEAAGYRWRYRGWSDPGHTTIEVFYGDRWHWLDTFLKFYTWAPDPRAPRGWTIASQEDIKANPDLITKAIVFDEARKVWYFRHNPFTIRGGQAQWTAPALLVCGDSPDGILSGVRSSRNAGSPRGWGSIVFDDPSYSAAVNLRPGYRLDLTWDKEPDGWYFGTSKNPPHHTCGDKDYRNCPVIGPILEPYGGTERRRTWSNGRLIFAPDLKNEDCLSGLEDVDNVAVRNGQIVLVDESRPGRVVIPMESPYVVAKAVLTVEPGPVELELSREGEPFRPISLEAFSDAVRGIYSYRLRLTFTHALNRLEVISVLQHNQEALPYLAPGRNRISVSVTNPEVLRRYRLVITYAYCPGWRERTPEEIYQAGAEIARAHFARWIEQPVVVRKVVDRVPCEFEILIPTPRGKQPVYPRMLFLRRELLTAGQQPAEVPTPPSEPTVGPEEELRELPTPWLLGALPPGDLRQ